MTSIHISTARRILQAPEPVNLKCWTKSGAIIELNDAIPLRYNFYEGTQQLKILASRQIRTIRLNLIFELNGTEVFCSIWTPAPNTTNPYLLVILSNISKTRKC